MIFVILNASSQKLTLSTFRYIFVYKSCECDVEAEIKAKAWW